MEMSLSSVIKLKTIWTSLSLVIEKYFFYNGQNLCSLTLSSDIHGDQNDWHHTFIDNQTTQAFIDVHPMIRPPFFS